jgi:hypothetical protein
MLFRWKVDWSQIIMAVIMRIILKSRFVNGLLTGHNTLRRHLHLMGLTNSPLCRRYWVEDETSSHIFCECEALASLRQAYLGSFFLDPEGIKSLTLRAIWNYSDGAWLLWTGNRLWGNKGPFLRLRCIRIVMARNQTLLSKSINEDCSQMGCDAVLSNIHFPFSSRRQHVSSKRR